MRVRSLQNFVSSYGGRTYVVNVDQELDMPEGADWLRSGLVQAIAVVEEGEMAVMPEPEARSTQAQPVTVLRGIGPATAEELAELGIKTVAELAAAEDLPDEWAEWQEAAREYLR